MKKIKVLLVCGSGASSGFMAANIRKVAKARNVDISVIARSDAEIDNYIDEVDLIMVGPHMAFILDELNDYASEYNVKVGLMRPDYYSKLDGNMALDHILEILNK